MITVLTCTYNRKNYLNRLKTSLEKQSVKDFEWVIIDDGSDDGTDLWIQSWEEEPFSYQYLKKKHEGKHVAINYGLVQSKGEWVFLVDSDDWLLENAIERVCVWIKSVESNEKFAAVAGLSGIDPFTVIGQRPDEKIRYVDCTNLERRKNHLLGDKAEIYRRSILMAHPFPQFDNEFFLEEGCVLDQIAYEGYKIRWFNEIIYIAEYLDSGLSRNMDALIENNWCGYTYSVQTRVNICKGRARYSAIIGYMINLFKREKKWCWIRNYIAGISIADSILVNLAFPIVKFRSMIAKKRRK